MRIIITGGGTGGHIYPALSVAKKLIELNHQVEFIGSKRGIENKIFDAQCPKHFITITGLSREATLSGLKQNINLLKILKKARKDAFEIIQKFNPDVVVVFGGYVSYPVVQAAQKLKVPIIVHEQNSYMGISNRKAVKSAKLVISSYPRIENYEKNFLYLGNPRESEMNLDEIPTIKYFENNLPILLVSGGSQGAKYFNQEIAKLYSKINALGYNIIHVTGPRYIQEYEKYANTNIKIIEYIDDMREVYKNCDVFILRAGATTIAEIRNLPKSVILVPSPYVSNDHQNKNADLLKGQVYKVDEAYMDKNIVPTIEKVTNEQLYSQVMINKRIKSAKPNALDKIIEQILKIGVNKND